MSKNIVMLVMDTARAKNFSCYGYDRKTSPFLDSVADEGIKFEKCYSNAPWTLPSHYSIFTGQDPLEHGYNTKDRRGRVKSKTLPEKLSEDGYETIGISNNGYISPLYGFDQYFDTFHFNADSAAIEKKLLFDDDELFMDMMEGEREGRWDSTKEKYTDFLREALSQKAAKSLINGAYYLLNHKVLSQDSSKDDGANFSNAKALEEVKETEEPYFLFINYVEPHTPYDPPSEYIREFLDEEEIEEAREAANTDSIVRLKQGQKKNRESQLLEALYDAEIKYLDDKIRELVENLEELDEDTVFFILSDHGEYFGERGLWEHMAKLGPEVLEVPLIVKNAGEGNPEDFFALNNLHDYILSFSRGENEFETGEFVSYYEGLESHQWSIETENFSEEFVESQVLYGREGKKHYFSQSNFEHINYSELRDRLQKDRVFGDIDF